MRRMLKTLTISSATAAVALIGLAAAPANAQDRHVQVVNETTHGIVQFFASNVERPNWEEDILGESVLPVGESANINIDDGTGACSFDFKAEFTNGQSLIRNNVNVCQIADYYYTR